MCRDKVCHHLIACLTSFQNGWGENLPNDINLSLFNIPVFICRNIYICFRLDRTKFFLLKIFMAVILQKKNEFIK